MSIAHLAANRVSETIGIYSIGFLDAAVALFDRARRGRGLVDCTFYPAAYCLRHGVELLIKQLSVHVAYELRDPSLLYEPNHDLENAWGPLSAHVESFIEGAPQAEELRHDLDVITSMVEEFHELDASGTLLRYPEWVKDGKTAKPNKPARPRVREDTHVSFDNVNLEDWCATAEATLAAGQALLSVAEERTTHLRHERGEPPIALSDLVPARRVR